VLIRVSISGISPAKVGEESAWNKRILHGGESRPQSQQDKKDKTNDERTDNASTAPRMSSTALNGWYLVDDLRAKRKGAWARGSLLCNCSRDYTYPIDTSEEQRHPNRK
jgi:hypothetical protein